MKVCIVDFLYTILLDILVIVIGGDELCSDYEYGDLGLSDCEAASKKLKGAGNETMEFRVTDSSEGDPDNRAPKYCYVGDNIVFYNIDPNGKRRSHSRPVCLQWHGDYPGIGATLLLFISDKLQITQND